MRIALLKIGSKVQLNDNIHVSIGEVFSIIKLFNLAGIDVDVFSRKISKTKKDKLFNDNYLYDICYYHKNFNDLKYSHLVVLNGPCNFFDLKLDNVYENILNYYIINKFNGKILYFLCDISLQLKQINKAISLSHYSLAFKKEDIIIKRKDIVCVTQARDILNLKDKLKTNGIEFQQVKYFPFEKFPLLLFDRQEFNKDFKVDLMYGGSYRKDREDDFVKFLFGYSDDINVEAFGSISLYKFKTNKRSPSFTGIISYDKVCDKMREALSTIIIGDKIYKETKSFSQRIYESIQSGNIIFIDKSLDKDYEIFKSEKLRKICYVNDNSDIEKRIKLLKSKPDSIPDIIKAQRDDVDINKNEYIGQFKDVIFHNFTFNKDFSNIETFNLAKVDNWNSIERDKINVLFNDEKTNRFSGLSFSSKEDSDLYYDDFYKFVENTFTPPRGNVRRDSKYAFIGIKPGSYYAHLSKTESAWLLGPSSKILDKLLSDLNIYPYFTNVYRSHKDEEDKNIDLIVKEIEVLKKICSDMIFVFMGNYEEYDKIINYFLGDLNYKNIWHPSYILRGYSENKYKDWVKQL